MDLRPPAQSGPARQLRRGALALRLLARRSAPAYWGVPLHRTRAASARPESSADLVLANDVEALPLARRVADGAPVLFDAHEWAPAQYEHVRWWPLLMRPQVDALLRAHLPHVTGMMTVAPGIAERYESTYGVRCRGRHERCAPRRSQPDPGTRADPAPAPRRRPARAPPGADDRGGAAAERPGDARPVPAAHESGLPRTAAVAGRDATSGSGSSSRARSSSSRRRPTTTTPESSSTPRSTRTSSSPCPTSCSTSSRRAWPW